MMRNKKSTAQLLEELSHLEQQIASVKAELTFRKNQALNADAVEVAEGPKQKEVLVHNRKKGVYNYQAFNTREVERMKVGHWIVADAYMKGNEFIRLMEQVETITETTKFYVINGKRVKKGTFRIVLN